MLYLLDANTLIDANRDYYPIRRIPEFWDWLIFHGQEERIKIPCEIYEEFKDKKDSKGNEDQLSVWAKQNHVKDALLFSEEPEQKLVSKIVYSGYVSDPTDIDIQKLGRDPILLSYAMKNWVLPRRKPACRETGLH